MQPQIIWWLAGLLVLFTLFFWKFPEIDVQVSALFYDDGFWMAKEPTLQTIRRFSINLTTCLGVVFAVLWLYRLLAPGSARSFSIAKLAFPTVALVLGPGLITNALLKDNWGRARPKHLEEFGGEAVFSNVWVIVDECARNCSFVSGETSSALWLLTLIPFLPLVLHKGALWIIAGYVVLQSTLRIAFGSHFISDAVFAVLINLMVFWWVWGWFFVREEGLKPRDWVNETRMARFFPLLK